MPLLQPFSIWSEEFKRIPCSTLDAVFASCTDFWAPMFMELVLMPYSRAARNAGFVEIMAIDSTELESMAMLALLSAIFPVLLITDIMFCPILAVLAAMSELIISRTAGSRLPPMPIAAEFAAMLIMLRVDLAALVLMLIMLSQTIMSIVVMSPSESLTRTSSALMS